MIRLTFKKAVPYDIPLLARLDKTCFNRDFDNQFTEEEYKQLLKKDLCFYILYHQRTPVGLYVYEKTDNEAEIIGLAVIPSYQHKGIGSFILKRILKDLKNKKIKIVVHPRNNIALTLYKKFGFIIKELDKEYYGPNQPRLILYRNP